MLTSSLRPVLSEPSNTSLCRRPGNPHSSLTCQTLRSSCVGKLPVVTLLILVQYMDQTSATFSSGPQGLMCED